MAKFNLKNYLKISGDEHIEKRLREDHVDEKDQINEAQLEDYRFAEQDQLTEKQLEKVRGGAATEVLEKRLDTEKSKFANKFRNKDAYNGDINKLEEKRLKNDPVEKEKYESASSTPKGLRWWEGGKSPDGLKVASGSKKKLIAQISPEIEFLEETGEDDEKEIIPPEWEAVSREETSERKDDFDVIDVEDSAKDMEVVTERNLTGAIPGVYIVLNYDVADFGGGVEDIQEAALNKVLSIRPELRSLIDITDFSYPREEDGIGEISLRAAGDQFRAVLPPSQEEDPLLADSKNLFEEVSYEEKDVGGTPMALGKIKVNSNVDNHGEERVVLDAINFIEDRHPNIHIAKESIDSSKIADGEIGYMGMVSSKNEFSVRDVTPIRTADVKKK